MTPHIDFDSPSHRLDLPSGASRRLVLRAGAAVICTEGSVTVEEAVNASEAVGGLPHVVSVRVNAGEIHAVAYGGAVRVMAIGGARVICLDAPSAAQALYRLATTFFRRFLQKNGNNRLGALHKISK